MHLTMSAAMMLIAGRVGMDLSPIGPVIFFVLAGVWFLFAVADTAVIE